LAAQNPTTISNLNIPASTSTESIIFSGDGKIMIVCVKQELMYILKVWKGIRFTKMSCQNQINETLRFAKKSVKYS